ncbi:MAG: tetratricopeptide repeat protein [Nitrospirae bacterium]|nr:MAG: tetratricopeptide repeat protein [Nitrospirota bacterium]
MVCPTANPRVCGSSRRWCGSRSWSVHLAKGSKSNQKHMINASRFPLWSASWISTQKERKTSGMDKSCGGINQVLRTCDLGVPFTRKYLVLFLSMALVCVLQGTNAFAQSTTWEALNAAGMDAYRQQHYAAAKELFLEALALVEGDDTDPRQATTLNNLAAVHEALGEYEQAELQYRHALTIIETIQGPHHPDVVIGLNNLAMLYFTQKDFQNAELLWQRALGILEQHLGPEHPHLIQLIKTLALVSQAQGHMDQAEERYKRAIYIAKHALGTRYPYLPHLLELYAQFLRQVSRQEEAVMVEKEAQAIRARQTSPPD